MMRDEPFACSWLIEKEVRSDTMVLEANLDHWNIEARGPRLEKAIFRSDLDAKQALDLVCNGEGDMDIVTEVSPADAKQVVDSEHANLVAVDANRVLVGIFNRYPESGVPLDDVRVRQAFNLAVDFDRVIEKGLLGYANSIPALTPPWCGGFPKDAKPYPHDVEKAKALLKEAGWPRGRELRIATPGPFEGVARIVAKDIGTALDIDTAVMVIPDKDMGVGARILIEKKISPDWDMLIHGWFDLSSEAPPAAVHREFFGDDGAFRAGPEDEEFNRLMGDMVSTHDGDKMVATAEAIDRYVYDQALALFLAAPQALYAVNKHVEFDPYKTTFELAETRVREGHWSLREGADTSTPGVAPAPGADGSGKSSTGYSGAGC